MEKLKDQLKNKLWIITIGFWVFDLVCFIYGRVSGNFRPFISAMILTFVVKYFISLLQTKELKYSFFVSFPILGPIYLFIKDRKRIKDKAIHIYSTWLHNRMIFEY